ncbi:MAG: helix-turn-helix transcriptional regulator, partial [Acidobacteria bacterium]|nr:helix-turn-helix transcriptional regulator [Acidobacteriota bacterium]
MINTPTAPLLGSAGDDYRRVEAAIAFLDRELPQQPELSEVAAATGLSPYHFQRLFRRWAGVSPKRFLQLLTVEHAKTLLEGDASVLDAALDSGLSGPGRLHDHFVNLEAMTPGEFKRRGEGLDIAWGVHPSPFGPMLVAATGRGLCHAAFLGPDGSTAAEEATLAHRWSGARL